MAKTKRIVLGSVLKPATQDKQGNPIPKEKQGPFYLKVNLYDKENKNPSVELRNGMIMRIETTKQQKESLAQAIADGKLDAEYGEKRMKQLEDRPDFVHGEAVLIVEE